MTFDEVDAIISQWELVRPEADVSPLAVLSRITRLSKRLGKARAAAFASATLETWEWDVLAALRRARQPLSPKQLLEATMVTSGTMTNRLTGLAERGLIQRVAHESDRRSSLVAITDAGIDLVDTALDALLEAERRILSSLTEDERDDLASLLRALGSGFTDLSR
ncbi:MAG TPA: MarR family transcriptional regulator [Candidatus Agrococcus pullicola]|uniref:MarR family transcriptional regulator n=1 Tax=Candidatus Agrococcus pullicola TaxID=2838429 RepID=A0A9D2C911_9MICO|nr:MarR family transcriptional regulator [Candidatus Agrococcus pullicola]